jgi:RNA recognition motif-containing protein
MVDLLKTVGARAPKRHAQENRDAKILHQIKFYFSDANLRRDTFMHRVFATDHDGGVAFEALCEFPILKNLKTTESDIIRVCSSDDFFILDHVSSQLRRNFDLYPNEEILDQLSARSVPPPDQLSLLERRTVYIDRLPVRIRQEQLRDLINDQLDGKVDIKYVSIPRHAVTGENLGGAFVELSTESQARWVVKKLRVIGYPKSDFRQPIVNPSTCPVVVMSMRKFKSLKRAFKEAKSLGIRNRCDYFIGYAQPMAMETGVASTRNFLSEDDDDTSDTESSLMAQSDINSLAHESVDIRRSQNPSSIRSNSVVLIEGLPGDVSHRDIHVWLSHSASVQFLEYDKLNSHAYARFASRRERDFFLTDCEFSKIPLRGTHPAVRALTPEECASYFEIERDRRRSNMSQLGPPESWSASKKQVTNRCDASSVLAVEEGWESHKTSAAFTDTVMGNPSRGEAGSSMLCGIKHGRHVARRQFIDSVKETKAEQPQAKRQRGDEPDQRGGKKTRRGKRGGRMVNQNV